MTPDGCNRTCNNFIKAVQGIITNVGEMKAFEQAMHACKQQPPFTDDVARYEHARYTAVAARNTAYRLMGAIAPEDIPHRRNRVLELRRLDALAFALVRLATDRVVRPRTVSWDAAVEARQGLTKAYASVASATSAWRESTSGLVESLESDLEGRRKIDKGASAAVIPLLDAAWEQTNAVLGSMTEAARALDALDVRLDVDVSEHVPSKKRNPGSPGPVPDRLLGELLLRLKTGSKLHEHVGEKRAVAIVATRNKYVFDVKERRELVDDGAGLGGRARRYENALSHVS